jgi:hypothetical protein
MSGKQKLMLDKAARRAGDSQFFMSGVFKKSGMDNASLASYLECEISSLASLALCRKPNPDSEDFCLEVRRIAEHTGADPVRLSNLILDA